MTKYRYLTLEDRMDMIGELLVKGINSYLKKEQESRQEKDGLI